MNRFQKFTARFSIPYPVFHSSSENLTFTDTTGHYEVWVKLNEGVSEPEVKLIISEDNGITYKDSIDCSLSEDRFIAVLPPKPFETVLNYYFETYDAKGEIVRLPTDAPLSTYEIKILSHIPGDANNDDNVNIFDLLELLKQLAGVSETNNYGDVDGNGQVNIFDLLELLKLLSGN